MTDPYADPSRPESDKWYDRAACLGTDTEAFFPTPRTPLRDINQAKAICRTCTVRVECRQDAKDNGDAWGIWGGENLAPSVEQSIRRREWLAGTTKAAERRATAVATWYARRAAGAVIAQDELDALRFAFPTTPIFESLEDALDLFPLSGAPESEVAE